ncbi:sensor histidine kinase [Aliarcobacter trophiarum]|uniref:sensor histidine kinase n=1 Tax=Aliarcobacter trophiarum TaxID=708186 RepID=UPI00100B9DC6|nr:cache domain-containing protein [Aliarcobacter trophiarum]RXI28611.1 histidine kinase [Aliarcobacter trophiarum]
MKITKEKKIVQRIKFIPVIFVAVILVLILFFISFEAKNTYEEEKIDMEQDFISHNKQNVQDEVYRTYNYIKYLQENTENELKTTIKNRVYEAHALATNIYETYKDKKSKAEIFELIKIALDKIRYNDGRGYFYIDDIYGNKLLLPLDKINEGRNFLNYKDANGYAFVQTIVDSIKNKTERYDEYVWKNPNTLKDSKKIAFYKYFEPFNVAIGTGEYLEEFEEMVQKKAIEYINLIRFSGSRYIFIVKNSGELLAHIKKELIGKDVSFDVISKNDNKTFLELAKDGDGFYSYYQKDLDEATKDIKTSYIKSEKRWGWIIGAGFYENDLEKDLITLREKIDEKYSAYMKKVSILFLILLFFLFFISKKFSDYLQKKLQDFKNELKKNQRFLNQKTKMATMGEMIENIAHQWKQPLSFITISTSSMRLKKDANILNNDELIEGLNKIESRAKYLAQTIDDFRNFFNPNKKISSFLLEECISKTLSLSSISFNTSKINIIKNIENIEFISNENELIQAFLNILNNAKDELEKRDYDRYIFIDIFRQDGYIVFEFKDNAGGIKEENLSKIFNSHFTTKEDKQGSGIGLYMTKDIIEKSLFGTIEAQNVEYSYENKNYRGAKFIIKFKDK